jgi:integrase
VAGIREVGRSETGPGVNDARQIDREVLSNYAAYLRGLVEHGDLAISTAQNRLSTVNRTTAALRGDQHVKLPSPSKALGMQRTGIRYSVPHGQDREQVKQIVDALCSCGQLRAAAIVLLARATGMRLREAILADLPRLSREANDLAFRKAPKVAASVSQRHVGSRWTTMFEVPLGLHGRCRLRVAAI